MSEYINRSLSPHILEALNYYPVILISGARQVGKSTLCRHLFPDYSYVNLEDNVSMLKAQALPKEFLESLGDKAVIDEVQNCPSLFAQIQAEVDTNPDLRYILTGSSDFKLMQNASESLAGRIALFTLPTLTFKELTAPFKDLPIEQLYFRGFYPGVVTGKKPVELFYKNYYSTYIEKDIRRLIKVENLLKFDMFMKITAARVGSEYNISSVAAEVGVSSKTINEWLSILAASYIIFALQPYYANISKRLSKMPKYYFHDTGLVSYLLGIENPSQLQAHPLKGALFENMAVAELVNSRIDEDKVPNFFFYRERNGKEVDLLQVMADGIDAYEIKAAKFFNPEFLKNLTYLKKVFADKVRKTRVIYDGEDFLPIAVNIRDIR